MWKIFTRAVKVSDVYFGSAFNMKSRQSILLLAIRKVLRPLVRLCLGNGVTYPMLLEELKQVFVKVADSEFPLDGKPQTDSRITLLTGVHRKDVHRIRAEAASIPTIKPNLSSQVIAQWLAGEGFQDAAGLPRRIQKTIADGGELSFEALVARVSKDIRSKPLLDEWLRLGAVRIDEDGCIELVSQAFVPKGDFEQTAAFLATNVHDHLAAAVDNSSKESPVFFERAAFSDGLSKEQLAALQGFIATEGMAFLRKVNEENIRHSLNPQVGIAYRVNTGVYFYAEPQDQIDE